MICAWIVTSSAVVGSSAISSVGVAGERHRDHRALAHAAGELVRIVVDARVGVRECPPARAARSRGRAPRSCRARSWTWIASHDLRPDRVDRVQRRHRILEDHRHLVAADLLQLALVHRRGRRGPCNEHFALEARVAVARQPEERHRRDALARARLADDPEHLAALELEADAVDGLDDAVLGRELDLQVS